MENSDHWFYYTQDGNPGSEWIDAKITTNTENWDTVTTQVGFGNGDEVTLVPKFKKDGINQKIFCIK